MIVLDEFPIRLFTLFFAEDEGLTGTSGNAGLLFQVLKIVRLAVRPPAVGPAAHFDLQNAQIHAHLDDLPAVGSLNQSRLDHIRLEIPSPEGAVDVLLHVTAP